MSGSDFINIGESHFFFLIASYQTLDYPNSNRYLSVETSKSSLLVKNQLNTNWPEELLKR